MRIHLRCLGKDSYSRNCNYLRDWRRSFAAVDSAFLYWRTLACLDPGFGSSQQEIAFELLQVPAEGSYIALKYCSYLLGRSAAEVTAGAEMEIACTAAFERHRDYFAAVAIAGFVASGHRRDYFAAVETADIAGSAVFDHHRDWFAAVVTGAVGIVGDFVLVDFGRSISAVVVIGQSMFAVDMSVPAAGAHMGSLIMYY